MSHTFFIQCSDCGYEGYNGFRECPECGNGKNKDLRVGESDESLKIELGDPEWMWMTGE